MVGLRLADRGSDRRMTRFALLVLLALAWFVPTSAQARDCDGLEDNCTYSQAWNACSSYIATLPPWDGFPMNYRCQVISTQYIAQQMQVNGQGSWGNQTGFYYVGGQTCPPGQETIPSGGCGCAGGFERDPYHPTECLTPAKCTARNSTLASGGTTRNYSSACVGGCQIRAEEMSEGMVAVDGWYSGTYRYTGNSCATPTTPVQTPDQAKEQPAEKCKQSGSFKFCVKPNGDQCLSASTGRQLCWQPGETGEKTDGNVLQKRNAGNTEKPPNLQLPNGDTLVKQGQTLTQTTTVTKNSTATTITTSTTNYTTQNGTNAGTKDSGQPADTGNPSSSPDGEGDEEGDENGVGGDGSCAGGWSPTGDPVLGGILTENWKQRCADEKVQADMRTDAQTLEGQIPAAGDPSSVWSDGNDSGAINEGWLVLGAGSCPVISVNIPGVGPWSPPPAFCSVIAALAALFQLAAYLWALRIVSS
jgi:hypothetical protein